MNVGFVLLVLAVVTAASYGFAGRRGLAALAGLALVAGLMFGMLSEGFLTMVAYALAFGSPLILASVVFGALAGEMARKRRYLMAILPLVPFAWMGIQQQTQAQDEASERQRATEFVSAHPDLVRFIGGPVKAHLASSSVSNDRKRDSYEFHVEARNRLYAIVHVDASGGGRDFRLACITSLPMGQREMTNRGCGADTVALHDPNWSLASAAFASEGDAPVLPAIPDRAEVVIFGAHDAHNTAGVDSEQSGEIKVRVAASDRPMVLVLANYKPVKWVVENGGRPIAAVLVTGLQPAMVSGVDLSPIPIGKYFPYDVGSPEEKNLRNRLALLIPNKPQRFNGAYHGREFTIPAPKQ